MTASTGIRAVPILINASQKAKRKTTIVRQWPTFWESAFLLHETLAMIATTTSDQRNTPSRCVSSAALTDPGIMDLLEQVDLATGPRCTAAESTRFLQHTRSLTGSNAATEPSAQDLECLRQATFRYRLETGEDRISGATLLPVLRRLGYLEAAIG